MLTTAKTTMRLGVIALGTIVINFFTLPSNAQSRTADSFNFDEISVGDDNNWDFSSEDETISIRNNLKQLREYDISGTENFDVRLIRERRRQLGIRRWGNQGDRPYYSVEDGIFPYYFRENRIYNIY